MANDMKFGESVTLFLNQFVMTDSLFQFDVNDSRPIVDARTFAGNAKVAGSNANSHTVSGAFQAIAKYGTNLSDDILAARIVDTGADKDLAGCIYGTAAGDVGREIVGRIDSNSRAANLTAVDQLSGGIVGDTLGYVKCLTPGTTITGVSTQAGVNVGAAALGTISIVVLRVPTVTTFTSAVVRIDESTDNAAGDPYAQTTGWTAIVGGGASFAADAVTFTTSVGWAILMKQTAREAWLRTNVTALTGTSFVLWASGGYAVQ